MSLFSEAMDVLEETSRTFFIPISRLPSDLIEAVGSAYLCLRAIDEIEDHPNLLNEEKAEILHNISCVLQTMGNGSLVGEFQSVFRPYQSRLPEVSLRVDDWVLFAPDSIRPRVSDATAAMADRMAYWAQRDWRIQTEADLNGYTFSVAGAVGLLLSDLWAWYDGTPTNREYAIGFGRGLQSVNIIRNREDDLARGVDFFPDSWSLTQMFAFSRNNLALAGAYLADLPAGPALDFCQIPYDLAVATLDVMEHGAQKLTRQQVLEITRSIPQPVGR
jgi:farnesyl-diphosphate farnesyltransferase